MYCFSEFCRFCVKTNRNLMNLFCVDDDLIVLSEKIRSLLPEIVYEEDNIPNLICNDCCDNIKKMYTFKKMCLKNNEILKLYASKLLTTKESPESLENELKLLKEKISSDNSDFNYSLIFLQQTSDNCQAVTKDSQTTTVSCDNSILNNNSNIKSENETVSEDESLNKNNVSLKKDDKIKNDIKDHVLDLKLECTEEDDESYSEDQQGDESMDCDEVISINDSENDQGDEDMMNMSEPMNLSAKVKNPIVFDSLNSTLPPYLASGNRGKTRTNDKYRVVYTEHQRLELEKEYLLNRFIPDRRRAELAISLGLTVRQIKIWFQNRRAKERKEAKRTDSSPQESNSNKVLPKNVPKQNPSTPERSQQRKSSTESSTKSQDNPMPEEFIRKQQEFYFQQQLIQQQQEILIQEQLLSQRKEFLNQQQQILQKEYHQQLYPHQQELLRQEEFLRQQKQFFNQQQQLLRQNLLTDLPVLTNAMILNQPLFSQALLSNQALLSTLPNQQILPQVELFSNFSELIKKKEELSKTDPMGTKELLPNLEELYRRKQELLKRNEERNLQNKK